ncbi:MAG: GNAT family N-acetyltransferase [Caldilinea sp. CFX5]|nr:GNAT family N-acetyltransferase [Caldilinea sp. CFX5]
MQQEIQLRRFQPADQEQAKQLILAGLADHWGEVDPSLNPDLNDITVSYRAATFLVCEYNGRIIGTGALVPRSAQEAEIVRMSVAADQRRSGIGTLILQKLRDEGKQQGFQRLILETTAAWHDVIAFYQRFGFQVTHYQDGDFGRDIYFALDLRE